MNRKIPQVMVSQHPDNASKPYWHTEAFVSDQHEVKECFMSFSKLGVSEYKWDWEGKFVEESVFERLISEYPAFFQNNSLGKDKFLTFRLPDFRVETEYRLSRAFMCIISASGLANQLKLHSPPIFEAILPMTISAHEMIAIQEAFTEIASLKNKLNIKHSTCIKHLDIIPLFEDVHTIMTSSRIVEDYVVLHQKKFGFIPPYIRPYVARSDSALSSGLVPSVLAIKIALSHYRKLSEKNQISVCPIIGAGSLPFRGGSTPYTVEQFITEYKGICTMLVQSGFQYDFPLDDVIHAVEKINRMLPSREAVYISDKDEMKIKEIIGDFERFYQQTVTGIGSMVYQIATFLPARRERLKHTGILKYPRMIGSVKVPRAIGFTASLYSIGIPPEFIGTGRGIKKAIANGTISTIEKYYIGIKEDLGRAGSYINKDVLKKLSKASSVFHDILADVQVIEKYIGHELGPQATEEKEHKVLTSDIYSKFTNSMDITEFIEEAGILRKSLG